MLPAATPRCQALIDHARAAMRRLTEVPAGAEQARQVAEQLDLYWKHTPLTVAVAGPLALRTAVLNLVAGEELMPPTRDEATGMVLTISRGTVLTCRARRRDGSVEELVLSEQRIATQEVEDDDVVGADAIDAPEPTTALVVATPPRRLWRRVVDWLAALFGRPRVEATIVRATPPPAPARARRRTSIQAPPRSPARQKLLHDVHTLLDASARGADVERIFVEVDGGQLPRGVAVVEVPSTHGERWLGLADGCLLACAPGAVLSPDDRALVQAARTRVPHVFAITVDGGPPPVADDPAVRFAGTCAAVLPRLPDVLLTERALRLAAGAHAALRRAVPALDESIARSEADLRARIARLESLRIADPVSFLTTRLDRLRGRVSERTHALIRLATDQVVELLGRFESTWKASLSAVLSGDELRAAIARIDEAWPQTCADLIEDVRGLLRGGLGRAAGEILQPFLAELAATAAPQREVAVGHVDLPTTWATAGASARGELVGAGSRLGTLLQSLDTMKAAAIERLTTGIGKARSRAVADLLDAEPHLREALEAPLLAVLDEAIRSHLSRAAAVAAEEEAALAGEQATLDALLRWRAVSRDDELRLVDLVLLAEADLSLQLAAPAA